MKPNTTKKLITTILAICLMLSTFSLVFSAETENETIKFAITYKISENGSVTGAEEAEAGESVTLTITPKEGYEIKSITANYTGFALSENNSFIMPNRDIEISVDFSKIEVKKYPIWTSVSEGGLISPAISEIVEGESQIFIISPSEGYKIKNVYVDNVPVGAVSFYVFNNVQAMHFIRAEFEKIEIPVEKFTVRFVNWDGSLISMQTIEKGKAAEEPEEPERDGYTFKKWDKAFDEITADTTIIAVYEKDAEEEEEEEEIKIEKLLIYESGKESEAAEILIKTLKFADTVQLKAKTSPKTEMGKITWKSSNTDIALVTTDGRVTVIGYGTVTISATYEGKTANYVILCIKEAEIANPDTCDD